MKRIVITALAIVLLLALSAAACGDPKATNQASSVATAARDGAATPDGAHLRVEVPDASATCDGRPREVRIWLDRLPPSPSPLPTQPPQYVLPGTPRPTPAPVPGLGGVEFTLTFDPAVAWLREAADVTLGTDLAVAAGPGAPGGYFLTPVRFDNYAGTMTVAAVKLGGAAGVDPALAGKSMLVLTVGMLPVGAGTTALKLTDVTLMADSSYGYPPVVSDASITVTGPCAKLDTPTPQAKATATTTAFASPTPVAAASVDIGPTPASVVGRGDCPGDWSGYVSAASGLSLCYGVGWALNVNSPSAAVPETFRLIDVKAGTFVGLSIVDSTPVSAGTVASLAELCGVFSKVAGIPFTEEPVQLGHLTGSSCRGHGNAGEEGDDPIHGFVSLPGGKYLQLYITRGSSAPQIDDDVSALLKRIEVQ